MLNSPLALMHAIWQLLSGAGPLANAVTFLAYVFPPLSALTAASYLRIRSRFRKRLIDDAGRIERLREDVERREQVIAEYKEKLRVAEGRCSELEEKSPSVIVSRAQIETNAGNLEATQLIIRRWIEVEGAAISYLLLARSVWSAAHAAGALRPKGLVAATALATGALALAPENADARKLLTELRLSFDAEIPPLPSEYDALSTFDKEATGVIDWGLFRDGDAAMRQYRTLEESKKRGGKGLIDLALDCFLRSVGKSDIRTIQAQRFKVDHLYWDGAFKEAVTLSDEVLEAFSAFPSFGPTHWETLIIRFRRANILANMNRYEDAISDAVSIFEGCAELPHWYKTETQVAASSLSLIAGMIPRVRSASDIVPAVYKILGALNLSGSQRPDRPERLMLARELRRAIPPRSEGEVPEVDAATKFDMTTLANNVRRAIAPRLEAEIPQGDAAKNVDPTPRI